VQELLRPDGLHAGHRAEQRLQFRREQKIMVQGVIFRERPDEGTAVIPQAGAVLECPLCVETDIQDVQ